MSVRRKILGSLAEVAVRRPWTVAAVSAVLTVISVAVIFLVGLEVQTSRVDLWPSDHPLQKRFKEYQNLFGSPFQLIVVVEGDDPAANKKAADRMAAAIRADVPTIRDVFYKVDVGAFKAHAPFFAPAEDLKTAADRLRSILGEPTNERPADLAVAGLVGALQQVNGQFEKIEDGETKALSALEKNIGEILDQAGPAFDELARWVDEPDRKEFGFIAEGASQFAGGGDDQDPEGYLVADGGRMIIMLCQPAENDDELTYLRSFVDPVRALAAKEEAATPGVTVGITGMPAFVTDELEVANHDLRFVTLLSAAGVLLLFLLGYGSLWNTIFVGCTLILGVVLDLAFTAAVIGHVNLISSLFVAVLLGLGIDYGIQLLNRFQEELRGGSSAEDATRSAVVNTGEGVLTGGVTTAVAFFTMAAGDFTPLKELGLMAGAGIVCILSASFVLLPALLVLRNRGREANEAGRTSGGLLGGRWLLPVLPLRGRRVAAVVVSVGVAGTVLLALPIKPLSFSNDLIAMLPANAPSVHWLRKLEKTGMFTSAFNATVAGSLEEARDYERRYAALPTVSRVQSLASYLPTDVDAKLPHVKELRRLARTLPRVTFDAPAVDVPQLREALDELKGYLELDLPLTMKTSGLGEHAPKVAALAKRVAALDATIAALPPEEAARRLGNLQARIVGLLGDARLVIDSDADAIGPEDLPSDMASLLYNRSDEGERFLVRVYPAGDINDDDFMPKFLAESRTVDPHVTGYPVNYYEFALVMQDNFRVSFLYAVGAIVLLLLLDLRRLRDVVLALVPLGMGSVCMVGAMNLAGIEYNLASLMAIPLIIGIGVAYGVYVIHRVREENPPHPRTVVRTTGKAVLFSGLTTMVSFGALGVASHRGGAGLGQTLLFGIGFCLIASIGFLPAMLRLVPPARRRGGSA